MSTDIEFRTCQLCKKSSIVYQNGFFNLVKYGVRHYAHPVCLAKKNGTVAARQAIPEHQHKSFDVALLDVCDWDDAAIRVKDQQIARQLARKQDA